MDQAYKLASESASMASGKAKDRYDSKIHGVELQPGCRVLIRNMNERGGPGKLRSYWEEQVYVVQKKRSECPVYEVQPETGHGRVRVLHRNMLLPCEFLPVEQTTTTLRKIVKGKCSKAKYEQQAMESSSEDESEWTGFCRPFKLGQREEQPLSEAEEFDPQVTQKSVKEDGQYKEMVECDMEEVVPQHVEEVMMRCGNGEEEASEAEGLATLDNGPVELDTKPEDGATPEKEGSGIRGPEPALPQRLYPLRKRKHKQTFTYHTLGEPTLE